MRYFLSLVIGLFFSSVAQAQTDNFLVWTDAQVAQLQEMVDAMSSEGLDYCRIADFRGSNSAADPYRKSRLATIAAKQLMQAHLDGCTSGKARSKWRISSDDAYIDVEGLLMKALVRDQLGAFFDALRPRNPNFQALRKAYASETDPAKRATLALNMERWRWMPLVMGKKYLLVNAASFEVTLWDNKKPVQTWPVIVGKTHTPTPVFDATVSGVIFNPWWEIPTSIVAEGIGSMVRNNPARARRKGYVVQNGRYRQRPGPGNALGQMKLVMPNSYSVYLHDTPGKHHFAKKVRTLSHGCIRVGDAIGFAGTLLGDVMSQKDIDKILTSRKTTKVDLSETIPLFIAYFTAEGDGSGVKFHDDIYSRDNVSLALMPYETECAG